MAEYAGSQSSETLYKKSVQHTKRFFFSLVEAISFLLKAVG